MSTKRALVVKNDIVYFQTAKDNYEPRATVMFSSKDCDLETQRQLSSIETWDGTVKESRAYWCGQLTNEGAAGMEGLGRWLRERYVDQLGFLRPTHIQERQGTASRCNSWPSVYYIANNFTRCIQSADSLLLGLYPPDTRSEDSLFPIYCDRKFTWMTPNESCSRSKMVLKSVKQQMREQDDPEMVAVRNNLVDHYRAAHRSFLHVAETLLCRLTHDVDVPPPDVATKDQLRRFVEYGSQRFAKNHGMNRDVMKLSHGVLLKKLVDHMNTLDNEFMIYSGHDGTILRLLLSLANGEDFNFPWPGYSCSLIFEVWERNKDTVSERENIGWVEMMRNWKNGVDLGRGKYVRILYEGQVVHWNDGKEFWPIEVFSEMWNDIMIEPSEYWHRECLC